MINDNTRRTLIVKESKLTEAETTMILINNSTNKTQSYKLNPLEALMIGKTKMI